MKSRKAKATLGTKPEVRIVVMNDGRIRILNNNAGARWAKVSQQSFAAVVRKHWRNKLAGKNDESRAEDKVRAAYPELFR